MKPHPIIFDRPWPIGRLLPLVLCGLVLASTTPVILLGSIATRDVSSRLLRDRSDLLIEAVASPLESLLSNVSASIDAAATTVAATGFDLSNAARLDGFMRGLLLATPQMEGIAILMPDETLRRWSRDDAGPERVLDGVVFGRQYLAEARQVVGGRWSAPYLSRVVDDVILTYRSPLRHAGELLGVLVAEIAIRDISKELGPLAREFDLVPFVLAGRHNVVAHPNMAFGATDAQHERIVPTIETVGDPVLAAIWIEPRSLTASDPLRRGSGHWLWTDSGAHIFVYRELPVHGDAAFMAGFHMSSVLTRRDRWTTFAVGGIGVALLLVAALAARHVATRLARPLVAFAEASRSISHFDFRSHGMKPWEQSRIVEVADTATAIRRMAGALTVFERYVPRALARELLTLGPAAGRPERRQMSILFLDLEGFTRMASGRDAEDVAGYLNTIFARAGPVIEANGGTIDKYTGDGLMAFWGAPAPDADHARHAVGCALLLAGELHKLLTGEDSKRQPACRVRIGLHCGEVIVGDLGYEGRTDYTVVGDAVNIAKRTEESLRGEMSTNPVVVGITEDLRRKLGAAAFPVAYTPARQLGVWLLHEQPLTN